MRIRTVAAALFVAALAGPLVPADASAQIINRLRQAAQNAVTEEVARQVAELLRNATRCVFDDTACVDKAKSEGKDVVLTDDQGEVLMDDEGKPITDPGKVQKEPDKPGTGAWANYDFVPGERVLFYDDFAADRVGDFPRRLTLLRGNWDVIEWQGRRLLRNTGPRHAAVTIPLPEALPERFTIEIEAYYGYVTHEAALALSAPTGANWTSIEGNYFRIGATSGTGVVAYSNDLVSATNRVDVLAERLMPIRIMVDGQYAKVYVGEKRVANVPNGQFVRSNRLYLENTNAASEEQPMLFGTIRIAAGGTDLYDVLERDGRVATQGILFATGSARIRPESTPTLNEIGTMLRDHPDLRIAIEGHTDDVGDDASNQTLSEQRAAAVKDYIVQTFGIAGARLQSAGFGETRPVTPNDSAEGRQQNRRVELVRIQ